MENNNDWRAEAAIAATLESLKLTVESVFVPFSQSRNKGEKSPSLNWRVTLKRDRRDVLTTNYMAGIAYCPGYEANKAPSTFQPHSYRNASGKPYPGTASMYRSAKPHEILSQYRDAICAAECKSGFPMQWAYNGGFIRKPKAPAIVPDPVDVLYSLTMDSGILNYGTFEEWASEFGYDTDSRSAESIYRACIEIALQFRAAIGDVGMKTLQTAFEDY